MIRKSLLVVALSLAISLAAATSAIAGVAWVANNDQPCLNIVTPTDPVAQTQFGWTVAVSGDTMVASRYRGDTLDQQAVYVFVRGPQGWTQQQKIALPDEKDPRSVAIQGDTLAINLEGEVQVWARESGAWTQQASLTDAGEYPGGLAIDGDTLLAGGFVFVRTGTTWSLQQRLIPSNGHGNDFFGGATAIVGDTAVIGASGEKAPVRAAGSVYVFERAGGVWTQTARLVRSKPVEFDSLGNAIAFDGRQIAACVAGWQSQTGAICVWERIGSTWTYKQQITSPDGRPGNLVDYGGDAFGISIGLADDVMVAGAPEDDDKGSNSGSVYVLRRVNGVWVHYRKIVASDGAAGDYFGGQLGVSDGRVVVSQRLDDSPLRDAGSVYAFDLGFATPAETTLTVNSPYVLVNDALPAWATLTAFAATQPSHGTVNMSPDAKFTYAPARNWRGADDFAYACTDGSLTSNSATVTVRTWAPTRLGLAASNTTPRYGGSASLKATLKTLSGTPVSGCTVTFEYLSGTKWVSLGSVKTGTSGTASKTVSSLKSSRKFRVRTAYSSTYGAAGSLHVRVTPHVSLSRPDAPSRVRKGRSFRVLGDLHPYHKSGTHPVKLYFYRHGSSGWIKKSVVSVTVKKRGSYSTYAKSVKLSSTGKWKVRAYHPADSSHAATWSSTEYFRVR